MRTPSNPTSSLALAAEVARAASRGGSARAATRSIATSLAGHLPLQAVEIAWLVAADAAVVVHARLSAGGVTLAVERRSLGDSFAPGAITRGEPLLLRGEVEGEAEGERAIAAHVGAGWFLVLPLTGAAGGAVGFATLYLAAEGRARPVLDEELVTTVGRLLGGAVERVSLVARVARCSRSAHRRLRAAARAVEAARGEVEAARRRADELEQSLRRARSRELEQSLQRRAEQARIEALEGEAAEARADAERARAHAVQASGAVAAARAQAAEATAALVEARADAEQARAEARAERARRGELELVFTETAADVGRAPAAETLTEGPVMSFDDAARAAIARALTATGGRVYGSGGAAELLGLQPSTLQSKMAKLGMRREAFL